MTAPFASTAAAEPSVIKFEFVPFTPDLNEPFCRLFAKEGFDRSSEYLRWGFRSVPGNGWAALARDRDREGEIIGVMAMVPTKIRAGSEIVRGFQAVDLVVDEDYRGRGVFMGLGKALLDGAESLGAAMVWGFPNESAAHAWFNRFGWLKLGPVPYMIRPLRSGFVLGRLAPAMRRVDFRLTRRPRPVAGLREVKRFDAKAGRLWQQFARSTGCALDRNADWLNWRIVDRPGAGYRTVAAYADGEMAALVTSAIVPRYGGVIHFVLEALCRGSADTRLLADVLRHEIRRAADAGADAALCWCPASAPSRGAYLRSGFVPLPEWMRPAKTYLGVKPLGPLPEVVTSDRGWYVSFLDFDVI